MKEGYTVPKEAIKLVEEGQKIVQPELSLKQINQFAINRNSITPEFRSLNKDMNEQTPFWEEQQNKPPFSR